MGILNSTLVHLVYSNHEYRRNTEYFCHPLYVPFLDLLLFLLDTKFVQDQPLAIILCYTSRFDSKITAPNLKNGLGKSRDF